MKRSWSFFTVLIAFSLNAQTNSIPVTNSTPLTNSEPSVAAPGVAATNGVPHAGTAPEVPETEIFSDSANFDLKSRVAVYIGHVRVVDPRMKLTCEIMTATVPTNGRPDHIVAEQNVVIDAVDSKGKPLHATGDKADYTYRIVNGTTNEWVVLTGSPRVQSGNDWLTGDTITWDRANGNFSATHLHTLIRPDTNSLTNAPAVPPEHKKSNP